MYYIILDTPYRNIFYHKYLKKIFVEELNWKQIKSRDEFKNVEKSKVYSMIDEMSFINNEIKGFWKICHKTNMANILQNSCYIPTTHIVNNLNLEKTICGLNSKLEMETDLYFLKKNNSGRGKDIFIISKIEDYKSKLEKFRVDLTEKINCNSKSELEKHLNNIKYHLNDKWVLQNAINPSLINNCKFHIRHMFMVRRHKNKLIGYLYNDFYIVKSHNEYNTSINKNVQLTGPGGNSIKLESCKWEYTDSYILKSFNMMKDISPKLLEVFEREGPNCYQLFGLDIMLDKNQTLCLMEINYGAAFTDCSHKLNSKIIRDLIHLAIIPEVGIECKVETGWQKTCEL